MQDIRRAALKLLAAAGCAVAAMQTASAASAATAASEQAISLDTPSGTIAGSLMLPDGVAKGPIVLIIAGSGPTDRDGNVPGARVHTDNLKMLARALADAGIASVRYDKRGIGASVNAGPREIDLRFDNYVDDAAAWVTKLTRDRRAAGVAIVGHSEGSLIGMLAARRSDVRGFVSVAGPARDAASILRMQLLGKLPPGLVAPNESMLTSLENGRLVDDVPPALTALYRPSVQPYLVSWFRYVPATEFSRLTIPCLVVQGDSDVQVPPKEAEALHAAQPQSELLIVRGMTHALKLAPPGLLGPSATYTDPDLPLAPEFTRTLIDFLMRVTRDVQRNDPQPGQPNP